jgi:hypothetical protein
MHQVQDVHHVQLTHDQVQEVHPTMYYQAFLQRYM